MPPDTNAYMIAGYLIFTIVMLLYLFSLNLRRRNLEQELQLLEEEQKEQ